MKLTQEQQDMLDGKYGKGTAYAMKIQVAIGECFDAKRMVPITRAHVALSNQEADLWFCEKLLSEGAHCRVAPTVNPGFCYDFFTKRDMVDPKFADLMQRTHNAYKGIGAQLTYNCTPYIDTNVPMYKEVIAFSESSATPYVNSVWGARSNREGANSALCAAVTGFVPEYGLLLDENRKGNILVEVQADMKTLSTTMASKPLRYKSLKKPILWAALISRLLTSYPSHFNSFTNSSANALLEKI